MPPSYSPPTSGFSGSSCQGSFYRLQLTFNMIQRHLMIIKLQQLNVPPLLIHWIYNFLSDRSQAVRVGSVTSTTITVNTGAPQGCVFSPFLYTLYTDDCRSPSDITKYFKYHKSAEFTERLIYVYIVYICML